MKVIDKKLGDISFRILDELFLDSDDWSLYDRFDFPDEFIVFMDMFIRLTDITISLFTLNNLPYSTKKILAFWEGTEKYEIKDLQYIQNKVKEVINFHKQGRLNIFDLHNFFINIYPIIIKHGNLVKGIEISEAIQEYTSNRAKKSINIKNKDFIQLREWVYRDFEVLKRKKPKLTPYFYAQHYWENVRKYAQEQGLKWMNDDVYHDYIRSIYNMFRNNKEWMDKYKSEKSTSTSKCIT